MARIIRWQPIRPANSLDYAFERIFDENWRNLFSEQNTDPETTHKLALDVIEADLGYTVVVNIPGVDAETIDIRVEEDVLTIVTEVPNAVLDSENGRNLLRERRAGKFRRSIQLPQPVDTDAIEATYSNGVLELSLPKLPEVQPKQIKINVAQ